MKHLFLDDGIIELQHGIERRWHQPMKHGPPVLGPNGPLEQPRLHIWNPPLTAEDGEGWRMWYIGGEQLHPLYATSRDGINWSRPRLDAVGAGAEDATNLIDLGFSATRKERRLVLCRRPEANYSYIALTRAGGRLRPLESDDGLTWRYHADHPGIPSDDEYRLGWDPVQRLLLATVKLGGRNSRVSLAVPEYGRAVALSTSADGLDWTDPEMILHADHLDCVAGAEELERHFADDELLSPLFRDPEHCWSDVYNMPVFHYEGLYIALPVLFHQSGFWQYPGRPEGSNQDGLLWPCLAWSRDLRSWERPEKREPFIPLSPCSDATIYDNGTIHACAPVRHDDELWFYYYGSRFSHVGIPLLQEAGLLGDEDAPAGAIFLARLRLDGFASLRAGGETGALLTKPVTVDGATLRINASASGGAIGVEIRDAETGRAIPGFSLGESLRSRTICFPDGQVHPRPNGWGARFDDDPQGDDSVPFIGDEVDAPVRWKCGEDLSALRGRKVRLLFTLREAHLYSFEFVDAD